MPSSLRRRFVTLADRGSFFVHESGPKNAPAVVLLHGLGASADLNWSATIPSLSRDFRVLAPDARGHGETKSPERFSLEDLADDVVALAEACSVDSFIVMGYSMGGAIAQLIWHRHPERLRGLVLCATGSSFRRTLRERAMFAALPPARLAAWAMPSDIACAAARRVLARLSDGASDDAMRPSCPFHLGRILEAADALGRFDSQEWISRVDAPSAVVVHLRDQLVPPDRQFALARALPQATVHPFDGDHFGVVRRPEAFVSTAQDALRSVRRRACVPIRRAG